MVCRTSPPSHIITARRKLSVGTILEHVENEQIVFGHDDGGDDDDETKEIRAYNKDLICPQVWSGYAFQMLLGRISKPRQKISS